MISDIVDALVPLQVAVEALCRRDANLITCDTVFLFTLRKLKECNSDLSSKLFDSLCKRVRERRNDLSGVLQYLHSGESALTNEENEGIEIAVFQDLFGNPSRRKTESIILQLIKRCHSDLLTQVTGCFCFR